MAIFFFLAGHSCQFFYVHLDCLLFVLLITMYTTEKLVDARRREREQIGLIGVDGVWGKSPTRLEE